jgi:hypothetical protein
MSSPDTDQAPKPTPPKKGRAAGPGGVGYDETPATCAGAASYRLLRRGYRIPPSVGLISCGQQLLLRRLGTGAEEPADSRWRDTATPAGLLTQLRQARSSTDPQAQEDVLARWGLRPLTGGRNNHLYIWTDPDRGPTCIKIYYKVDDRRRADREWAALTLLADHGVHDAPEPLWCRSKGSTEVGRSWRPTDPRRRYPVCSLGQQMAPGGSVSGQSSSMLCGGAVGVAGEPVNGPTVTDMWKNHPGTGRGSEKGGPGG